MRSGDTAKPAENPASPHRAGPGSAPLADARHGQPTPVLPRAALDFLAHYYPRGKVAPQRRLDAYDQVLKTLTVGAKFGRGRSAQVARAITPERLAAKCVEVMQEHVRDPDKAVVILLTKLADTSSLVEAERHDANARRTAEESQGRHRLHEAEAWLVSGSDAARAARRELGDPESVTDHTRGGKPQRQGEITEIYRRTIRLLELYTAHEKAQETA